MRSYQTTKQSVEYHLEMSTRLGKVRGGYRETSTILNPTPAPRRTAYPPARPSFTHSLSHPYSISHSLPRSLAVRWTCLSQKRLKPIHLPLEFQYPKHYTPKGPITLIGQPKPSTLFCAQVQGDREVKRLEALLAQARPGHMV